MQHHPIVEVELKSKAATGDALSPVFVCPAVLRFDVWAWGAAVYN
jgi:hypothetical protein